MRRRGDIPNAPEGQSAAGGRYLPLPSREAADRVNRSWLKRAMDILGAGTALVGLSPLLLFVAILIRIDSPGPVIYRQRRYGRNGTFNILKFRTMTASASEGAFQQARRNDERITRIGRFLRRTNLDELPQLFNVLIGQMSLIGPRPHPVALDDRFVRELPELMRRYAVRPGISGWAQVNGCRGETADVAQMGARLGYDLEYIARWSIRLDLVIIFRTLFDGKAFENAH